MRGERGFDRIPFGTVSRPQQDVRNATRRVNARLIASCALAALLVVVTGCTTADTERTSSTTAAPPGGTEGGYATTAMRRATTSPPATSQADTALTAESLTALGLDDTQRDCVIARLNRTDLTTEALANAALACNAKSNLIQRLVTAARLDDNGKACLHRSLDQLANPALAAAIAHPERLEDLARNCATTAQTR